MRHWLAGALLLGALVRLPGVAWGVNWPDGFTSHHPDEYTHLAIADAIISPLDPRTVPAYPKAMGAYAATPYLLWYAFHGSFGGPRVHIPWTIGAGRLISVGFGLAAILIVFLIGRDAFDPTTGLIAAWLLALGGLHVTQSHFFLADVPATTWTLLAVWSLWRDLTRSPEGDHEALRWAAFAAGAAFAFKLLVFVLPAVAYAIVARRGRAVRAAHAAVFGSAGFMASSLGFETPATLYQAITGGINYPYEFSRLRGALLYAVQFPGFLSLPLLLAAAAGTVGLVWRLRRADPTRRRHALVVFGSVPLVGIAFVLLQLDHFPRHWVFLIPWASIAGGWYLARWTERHAARSGALVLGCVFLWMLAFVVDSERFFILEPRNQALHWLRAHVPPGTSLNWMGRRTPHGYRSQRWFFDGEPDVLVVEMGEANHSLSGVNWRDSYPSDYRQVFDGRSPERVAAIQSLFKGTSPYRIVARFPDAYVMPEYRLGQKLLGDRARSFITEVVIFKHRRTVSEAAQARPEGSR